MLLHFPCNATDVGDFEKTTNLGGKKNGWHKSRVVMYVGEKAWSPMNRTNRIGQGCRVHFWDSGYKYIKSIHDDEIKTS